MERGVEVAVIYPGWFFIPPTWNRCGAWMIRDNIVNGDAVVALYALEESAEDRLTGNLREFAPHLPPTVLQQGRYCQAD